MKNKDFRTTWTVTLDSKEKSLYLELFQTDLETGMTKTASNTFNLEVIPLDMAMQTIVNILMPRK